jgi:TATA-box binding protein (TBP) (component of TFIID and TFIIIB)
MDLDNEWMNFCNNNENNKLIIRDKKINNNENKFTPKCSELYISTQTKIAYLNENINLLDIFWKLKILPYQNMSEGILKKSIKINNTDKESVIELEKTILEIKKNNYIKDFIITQINDPHSRKLKYKDVRKVTVGISSKDLLSTRKKEKGAFYNCFALIIRFNYNNKFKEVHIKVFNTGKLEIPGIQHDDLLIHAINYLIKVLQPYYEKKITYDLNNIQTVLINSNFTSGFYIDRNKLYNILKYNYNLDVIYDPCSYPGIQCKFYYNKITKDNGICSCDIKCCKKKKIIKKNSCTEVSFMIFRTGSVLIVGNCSKDVLNIVYKFLSNLLKKEYNTIYINNCEQKKKKKKKKRKKTILFKIKQ